ncbi:hypothetical protein E6O75_ATG05639 [Venturia nashicola]|uniref:Uncharacterized protein n=1 Tax=Venturia nashicola TaxID=86259 RepID=A0A4Z1PGX2_9PEZI|nr:hypothetical protein E6O75_ATG05639 [Venturia nashicola]
MWVVYFLPLFPENYMSWDGVFHRGLPLLVYVLVTSSSFSSRCPARISITMTTLEDQNYEATGTSPPQQQQLPPQQNNGAEIQ